MVEPEQEFDDWARAAGYTEMTWRLWSDHKRALWQRRREYLAGRYADDAPINRRYLFARWLYDHQRIREDLPI